MRSPLHARSIKAVVIMDPTDIPARLTALREIMKEEGVQAYLVPSTDPHQSEYLPECWKRRMWISGFTGSAGDVVVTLDSGGLWTDGRYFLQAEEQLAGSGIDLYKMMTTGFPKLEEWVADTLKEGEKLGIDPRLLSLDGAHTLEKKLREKGVLIKYVQDNLIDRLWEDQPSPSKDPVRVLDDALTGENVADKLTRIREKMGGPGCSAHILSALDTIAWTFNLRGADIEFNPVFISYAVIEKEKAHLFIDTGKITDEVRRHLGNLVEVHPYEDIKGHLEGLSGREIKIWIDPKTVNKWIMLLLKGKAKFHRERSPVTDFKSRKNGTELQGMRDCQVVDGVAMVRFLKWLEGAVPGGGVTEISASDKLEAFRAEGDKFVGLSFSTISGYRGHGAIIHYTASAESDVELKAEGIYLVDSGGQYLNGTTDITRTMTLGKPTDEEREMFTRVLKGHIDLAMLRFPKGFCGKQLELPARASLWKVGKNYNHGTGHGVGHFLNVHEGPMMISPRDQGVPLEVGNVLSNEPGYYKPDGYGIRIENLIACVKDEEFSTDDLTWLSFETITLCPIDLELVEPSMLTAEEREWFNSYHAEVYGTLSPHLDDAHREWLKSRTRTI